MKTDQSTAESEYRRGGKSIHIHQRGTFWSTPSQHISSYKRPKPVKPQSDLYYMCGFAFWRCYGSSTVSSDSCIQNLFLIISPHGLAAFPPALNWKNLPAGGRPQRILSLSPDSLFTAMLASCSGKNALLFQAALNHPRPGQGSHQEGSILA